MSRSSPPVRRLDETTQGGGSDAHICPNEALASGTPAPAALTDGFVNAFWAGAAISFLGLLVSIFVVRGRDLRVPEQEVPEPAFEEAA